MTSEDYPVTAKQARQFLIDGWQALEAAEDAEKREDAAESTAMATAYFTASLAVIALLASEHDALLRRIKPGLR